MKLLILIALITSSTYTFASTNNRCPGIDGYEYKNQVYRNPKAGGFVSHDADVAEKSVSLKKNVVICSGIVKGLSSRLDDPDVRLSGKVLVKDDAMIIGSNILISGDIEIGEDVFIGSDTTIIGSGILPAGNYEDQTVKLKDKKSKGATSVRNELEIGQPVLHYEYRVDDENPIVRDKYTSFKLLTFTPLVESRHKSCSYKVKIHIRKLGVCEDGEPASNEIIEFNFDAKAVKRIDYNHLYSGFKAMSIKFDEGFVDPTYRIYGRNFCGPQEEYSMKEIFHRFSEWGIQLAISKDRHYIKSLKNKFEQLVKDCK
jgi:hypothetical protein